VGQGGTITANLKHLTSATFRFASSGVPSGAGLSLGFDLGDTAQGSQAVVTTFLKAGGQVTTLVPLNGTGVGAFEANFGSDTVASVEVTVVNASLRYSQCYKNKTKFACGGGKPVDEPVNGSVAVEVVA